MHVFYAVVVDLWRFVQGKESSEHNTVIPDAANVHSVQVHNHSIAKNVVDHSLVATNSVYVQVSRAHILTRPVWSFDGVLQTCNFGTQLKLYDREGMYYRVSVGAVSGWVSVHEVTTQETAVFPVFVTEEIYTATHPTTVLLRKHIHDSFGTTPLHLSLCGVEYVSYRLMRKGITVPWSMVRPRTAGKWHTILRGARGVEITTFPRTGAVMEYIQGNGDGVVAYTTVVAYDQAITIEVVGLTREGEYTEVTLTADEWRELRPVWITVS